MPWIGCTTGRFPTEWSAFTWPALSLSRWLEDIQRRLRQLESLPQRLALRSVWLGGFFFPRAFLTAAKQELAHSSGLALDIVVLKPEVTRAATAELLHGVEAGSFYLTGLFVEGAVWDRMGHLADPPRRLVCSPLPVVKLSVALANSPLPPGTVEKPTYLCPLYVHSSRTSQNFVSTIPLRCEEGGHAKWTLRGVAALCVSPDP